jgi:hypothetical protein
MKALLATLLIVMTFTSPQAPTVEISGHGIQATFHPPDPKTGYYRGTRFDWSGVVASLKWNGHEYFGQWFEKYDPQIHDAITGPVEEFLTKESALGYEDAKPGETFVRIGVGLVRKPTEPEAAYQRFKTYDIVDPGKWTVKKGGDWIDFVHEFSEPSGYAYVYRKRMHLAKDSLVIEHELKNTGKKAISTRVYDHNFFVIDGETTGPDFAVKFPFELRTSREALNGLAEARGKDMAFLKTFEKGQTAFTELSGFGTTASDYDIHVENRKTGAGVRIRGDRPLVQVYFWSAWKTVCPEPYIDVSAEAGKTSTWRIAYEFYKATGK